MAWVTTVISWQWTLFLVWLQQFSWCPPKFGTSLPNLAIQGHAYHKMLVLCPSLWPASYNCVFALAITLNRSSVNELECDFRSKKSLMASRRKSTESKRFSFDATSVIFELSRLSTDSGNASSCVLLLSETWRILTEQTTRLDHWHPFPEVCVLSIIQGSHSTW